jgi:hypothetical protein
MRLLQFKQHGQIRVGISEGAEVVPLRDVPSTYALALKALETKRDIATLAQEQRSTDKILFSTLENDRAILLPLDHPEPARLLITGTGLTHIGSAEARDRMHRVMHDDEAGLSDSMKMFRMGVKGGKPSDPEAIGVEPEWFFKGTGDMAVAHGADLELPEFAKAGAEEPEIVALHIIGPRGEAARVGFAMGNDFSDHITEQSNYLYLAPSKLLPCSIGPELLLGELPAEITGKSRILRDGDVLWQGDFASGENNMCHSVRNLEYHHFKHPRHRIPNSIHAHFLGCPVMSFNEGIKTQSGDVFEIDVPCFGHALRNRMVRRQFVFARPYAL